MKNKILAIILIVFTLTLCAVGFVACNKDKDETAKAEIERVVFLEYPQKYYEVGDNFSTADGVLEVTYSDGTVKEVSTADPSVTVKHNGTAIAREKNAATLYYENIYVSYTYCVSPENEGIKSVALVLDKDKDGNDVYPMTIYAKSTIRSKPKFNDAKIVVKYLDDTKADTEINLDSTLGSFGVTITGADFTTVGNREYTISYKVTDIKLPYKVVENDWIESEIETFKDTLRKYYVVGEDFDAGDFKIKYAYNSGKVETVAITDADVEDFNTATAGERTMYITTKMGTSYSVGYTVYDDESVASMALSQGVRTLEVNDKMTFDEFKAAHEFVLTMDDENTVTVTGADEGMVVYKIIEGVRTEFTKTDYDNALKLGQVINLDFEYKAAVSLGEENYTLMRVLKKWNRTVITNWSTVKSEYVSGESFSFGTATIQFVYDDNTFDEAMSLQELYEMTILERTGKSIDINKATTATDAETFDTTTVGTHTEEYYIVVQNDNGIMIDGVERTDVDGKLKISYTVTAAE